MNKLKKIALVSFMAITVAISAFAEIKEIDVATRVRKEASGSSDIVTVLYPGDDVEVLGKDGTWSKIQRGEYVGYVKTEFLKALEDPDENYNKTSSNKTTDTSAKNEVENKTENKVENKTEEKVQETVPEPKNETVEVANTTATEPVEPDGKLYTLEKIGMRNLPNFFSKVIKEVELGIEINKVDEISNWYKIELSDGSFGWVLKSKITDKKPELPKVENVVENVVENEVKNEVQNKVEEPKKEEPKETSKNTPSEGTINVETANVREKASMNSEVVDTIDYGDKVQILGESNDFYKIKSGSIEGYISKRLISTKGTVTSRSLAEERKEELLQKEAKREEEKKVVEEVSAAPVSSGRGSEVAEYAKQYLGVNYVLGGKSPETGFDCAGFTRYVFKNFGFSLGSIASSQNAEGDNVGRNELQVGDLLLFQNEEKTKIGHTGIYIGDGNFIHAANPQRGVVIDNINTSSYYNTRFVNAKRLVK